MFAPIYRKELDNRALHDSTPSQPYQVKAAKLHDVDLDKVEAQRGKSRHALLIYRTVQYLYHRKRQLLYRLYLPGDLKKHSTFRNQVMVSQVFVNVVSHACHDHVMPGGHLH